MNMVHSAVEFLESRRPSGTIINPMNPINQKLKDIRFTTQYLLKKIILIILTIFIGTFITVLMVNQPMATMFGLSTPQLDKAINRQIDLAVRDYQMDHFNTLE